MVRHPERPHRGELDMSTLVWTRGRGLFALPVGEPICGHARTAWDGTWSC